MFVSSFARIICDDATGFPRILTPHGGSKSVAVSTTCKRMSWVSTCSAQRLYGRVDYGMPWFCPFVPHRQARRFVVSCDAFIWSLFENTFVLLLFLEHVVIRIFNNTKYDNAHFVLLFNEFLKRCIQSSNSAVWTFRFVSITTRVFPPICLSCVGPPDLVAVHKVYPALCYLRELVRK